MKTLPLLRILTPLIYTGRIIGTIPFKVKAGKVTYSFLNLLYTAVLTSGCLYFTFDYFSNFSNVTYSGIGSPHIMRFMVCFRGLSFTIAMLISILLSHNAFKAVVQAMSDIEDIDQELVKWGQKQYLERRNYQLRHLVIKLSLIVNFVFNTVGSVYIAWCKSTRQVAYFIISWYPRMVNSTKLLTYLVISAIIKSRFEAINNIIEYKIKQSVKIRNYPVDSNFCYNIDRLISLHKNVVKVAEDVVANYAMFTLVWIGVNVILLIGDAYALFFIVMFDDPVKNVTVVCGLLKNALAYVFDLYTLATKSNQMCYEADASKTLLVGIKIDINKEEERNSLIASVLRLMENKLEVTACKLFRIDNALLFSICGATFSYLFIMLQFDKSAGLTDKLNTTTNANNT